MSTLQRNGHSSQPSSIKKVKYYTTRALITVVLLIMLAACSSQEEPVTLKMALLPIMDTLPMYVAQEQGYFAEEGIVVEIHLTLLPS